MAIMYPYGNLSAIDTYYFGVSCSTESGLNPVDLKALKTYQQIFLYIVPIITNLGFINILVVVVRLRWFSQKLKGITAAHRRPVSRNETSEQQGQIAANISETRDIEGGLTGETVSEKRPVVQTESSQEGAKDESKDEANLPHIKFAPDPRLRANEKGALYIPGPRERDNGEPITMTSDDEDEDQIKPIADSSYAMRRTKSNTRSMRSTRSMSKATSVDRVVSSMFVLGSTSSATRSESKPRREPLDLSSLTPEELGGVEYRALRVLLKITIGYFFGLHIFGVICLLPWIHLAPSKYQDLLASHGVDKTWWAFYSAQTMVNNLGLTLTPDSMISFRDTVWPMIVMSFLAFAGNTFYPFNVLAVGHRILAAIFQSASSRHTGTSTFNLANVNPAVQFSLLVMMYISVYPIAISIRMSESYEEKPVGLYAAEESLDEDKGSKTYLINHMRNQLSFDLWYIFLGVFCICIGESKRIMNNADPAFSVFAVFFEVVSAYGNVGLSLGYPTNATSLSGHFNVFGKVVICFMMLRGRHRGLPYALDRAINLPSDIVGGDDEQEKYRDKEDEDVTSVAEARPVGAEPKFARGRKMMRALTQ
ncbi:Potassium transport protein 1 [Pyrenophora tritici-repentis]|nr:Potassium transport protein 1 [Pyrenophora tritici-repentis]KAI0610665.1 Potassium transport protein 1 [Pyrenophora tritici-repentis]